MNVHNVKQLKMNEIAHMNPWLYVQINVYTEENDSSSHFSCLGILRGTKNVTGIFLSYIHGLRPFSSSAPNTFFASN